MNDAARAALYEAFLPALVPLADNLTGVAFPLMKVFPADLCVRRALHDGRLIQDSLVIETSSGTMALALAIVCRWRNLGLTIVSDHACDESLRRRLAGLGAVVEIVTAPAEVGGYQRARLDRLEARCAMDGRYWWINQYDNPANGSSYSRVAAHLLDTLGRVDCLVGTVGSGGSMCGTSAYLRRLLPALTVIGVDTFGSVLFGQPDGPRRLRGLGNSIMPRNLDHTAFDEVHWVSAAEAFAATRTLHYETTLFRGPTSGAAWLVAKWWAGRHPRRQVVCLFPDDGTRYIETVYDEAHTRAQGLWLDSAPEGPREVTVPAQATTSWSRMAWNRRSLQEAIRETAVAACS